MSRREGEREGGRERTSYYVYQLVKLFCSSYLFTFVRTTRRSSQCSFSAPPPLLSILARIDGGAASAVGRGLVMLLIVRVRDDGLSCC